MTDKNGVENVELRFSSLFSCSTAFLALTFFCLGFSCRTFRFRFRWRKSPYHRTVGPGAASSSSSAAAALQLQQQQLQQHSSPTAQTIRPSHSSAAAARRHFLGNGHSTPLLSTGSQAPATALIPRSRFLPTPGTFILLRLFAKLSRFISFHSASHCNLPCRSHCRRQGTVTFMIMIIVVALVKVKVKVKLGCIIVRSKA